MERSQDCHCSYPNMKPIFIFAAFAEEWGLWGVFLLCALWSRFGDFCTRLCSPRTLSDSSLWGGDSFNQSLLCAYWYEYWTASGDGNNIPFLSYGGSHL